MTIEEMQKSTEFQVFDRKSVRIDAKALESYKEDRKPVFKSSPSQFMTIIYSVDYTVTGKDTGNVTKQSLSSH